MKDKLSTLIKVQMSWMIPLFGAAFTFTLVVFFFNSFDKLGVLRPNRRDFISGGFLVLWFTSIICLLVSLRAPDSKRPTVVFVSLVNFLVTFLGFAIFGAGE